MSDPMTSGEIEDVISSIRRLVAEADGSATAGRANGDRLVLTPSLRVDDTGDAASRRPPEVAHGEGDLEASVAELEAALAATAGKWEAEPAEAPARARATVEDDADGDDDWRDPSAAGDDAEEAVDDGWEPAEPAATPFQRLHPETIEGRLASGGTPAGDEATVALFAHVRAGRQPDGAAAPSNVATPDAESLLDENDLRQLVAEVLREELKGALGERITRNVRKLVRREIAQALSSMELD